MQRASGRGPAAVVALVAAAGLASCGSSGDGTARRSRPRPPSPILITASISNRSVSVSRARVGAGPIDLLVTNQTGAAQRITLETRDRVGGGPGFRQQTSPINPRDTARISADVGPGRYVVHVTGDGIRPATMTVARRRPSAQGKLLQP